MQGFVRTHCPSFVELRGFADAPLYTALRCAAPRRAELSRAKVEPRPNRAPHRHTAPQRVGTAPHRTIPSHALNKRRLQLQWVQLAGPMKT